MRKLVTLLFTLLSIHVLIAAEQPCLIVESIDASEVSYALVRVQRIDFNGSQMQVVRTDNSTADYQLAQVQQIKFATTVPTTVEDVPAVSSEEGYIVYPNPTSAELKVLGLTADTDVHVLSFGGKVMMSASLSADDNALNLSSLAVGNYLLVVGNTVVKFIKK